MMVFGLRCIALFFAVLGFFSLFKINIKDLFSPRQSIKSSVQQAKTGKKSTFRRYCSEAVQFFRLLQVKNPENVLAIVVFGSVMLGVILGIALNNILLSVIFAVLGFMMPFWVIQFIWSVKEQKMSKSLETALSRITSSYLRPGMTFEDALKENMSTLPSSVRPIFETILLQMTYVDSDIVKALTDSKLGIQSYIYKEWVNAVIRCHTNQSLKPTLPHIVNKFTEQRIIVGEARVMMQEYKRNFFIMTGATIISPFFMYLINREWFSLLFTSIFGKILLASLVICLAISLFIGIPALNPDLNIGYNVDEFEELI